MTGNGLRVAIGMVAGLTLTGAGVAIATPATPPAGRTAGGATQQLAALDRTTAVFARPAPGARRLTMVKSTRPITGGPTVLPVIAHTADATGAPWVKVLLPGRPNGHSGWIRSGSVTLTTSSWRVSVRVSTRRVTVFRDGRQVRSFSAVVGLPSTPTPFGRFFLEETVQLKSHYTGAPYALALSARSNVYQEFKGGPGQVALHGTKNVGGVLGTAASHGCIRLDTGAITWLAGHIGPGTRVTITA